MGRCSWKAHGVCVRKSEDFGELSVVLKGSYDNTKYSAFGEFTVTFDDGRPMLLLAAVAISEATCTLYDMEKDGLLTKTVLTLAARELSPRALAFFLANVTIPN